MVKDPYPRLNTNTHTYLNKNDKLKSSHHREKKTPKKHRFERCCWPAHSHCKGGGVGGRGCCAHIIRAMLRYNYIWIVNFMVLSIERARVYSVGLGGTIWGTGEIYWHGTAFMDHRYSVEKYMEERFYKYIDFDSFLQSLELFRETKLLNTNYI